MSEAHTEEHSSPIKTPKQLIIVVVLAFVVPIVLIVMLTQLVTGGAGFGKDHPGMSDEAIARRLKPVGEVVVMDASSPKTEKTGQQVVEAVCAACHATGVLNAPKVGDKDAWARRLAQGYQMLTQNAVKGMGQMPPRGGNPDLTDTEIARAVAYMANQAGAKFKEPESKPAPAAKPAEAVATPTAAPVAAEAKGGAAKGKTVYEGACLACHATGAAGAPKAGDKAAWAPRLKSGMDALYTSALKGKNAMPPKGGNMSLADADVKAAVDYLTGLAK
jgi:cytochrome c5